MKKSLTNYFLTSLILCGSLFSKAQTFKIDTVQISYENKSRTCLSTLLDPEAKKVKKAWAKYLKKNYEIKLKGIGFMTNKETLKAIDVMWGTISTKRMNVYTKITTTATGCQMSFFTSLGYDIYIEPNTYPKEFKEMGNIFNTFLHEFLNKYYTNEIEVTAKKIKKLRKQKITLQKSIVKNEKQIKKNDNKIKNLSAVEDNNSPESIKANKKSAELKDDNTHMTKENQKAQITIQSIDKKVPELETKLNEQLEKQKNLIEKQ